jgi:hypothetical protein
MRIAGAPYLFVAAALALGCSAGADSAGISLKADASWAAGNGGGSGARTDGGYLLTDGPGADDPASHRDASSEPVGSNLTADAVTFNWDTLACLGCSAGGGGAGGSGGTSSGGTSADAGGRGAGGASGMGGSISVADAAPPLGGSAAGGASAGSGGRVTGSGGSAGGGGIPGSGGGKADGGAVMDAGVTLDAPRPDLGPPSWGDAAADAGVPDAMVGGPDARPADLGGGPCQARLVPVVPVLDRIDRLVAGENTRVVLRAVVDSGGPGAGATWTWSQTWKNSPLTVAQIGVVEPDTAAFAIPNPGQYVFSARSGSCYAELAGFAVTPNVCTVCDKSVLLRAAPPITSDVPTQSGGMSLDQTSVILSRGVSVMVAPSSGGNLVRSYVRINDTAGGLISDGMADITVGGFVTRLRLVDSSLAVLKYDVLVVPLDGEDGATIAATAPQLYQGRDPTSLNKSLPLAGGYTITGTTLDARGQPVVDARVMLTNQDPASSKQRPDLVFSSVGRSNAQGKYTLHVQPGAYWVSFAPPLDSGLTDARSDSFVTVSGDSTLSFQWSAASTAALSLTVVDATGAPVEGTSVRVTSLSQPNNVGSLSGALISSQQAKGDVQVQTTTDATGAVQFPKLPANADYAVLLMPAAPGPSMATTALTVRLDAGGTSRTVALSAQAMIRGKLVVRAADSLPIDFTTVSIVGYDRSSDAPEAARAVAVNADGTFAFGATPKRPYVLLAVPDVGSGFARSFVGPGPLQGSEFVITQNLLTSIAWKAKVVDDNQNAIADTALEAYCDPSWPNCVDPAVPLGETMSGTGGAFQLELADPASRF